VLRAKIQAQIQNAMDFRVVSTATSIADSSNRSIRTEKHLKKENILKMADKTRNQLRFFTERCIVFHLKLEDS